MVLKIDDLVVDDENTQDHETKATILPPKPLPPLDFEDTERIQLSPQHDSSSGIDAIRGRVTRKREATDPMMISGASSSPHSTMELRMDDLVEEELPSSREITKEQVHPFLESPLLATEQTTTQEQKSPQPQASSAPFASLLEQATTRKQPAPKRTPSAANHPLPPALFLDESASPVFLDNSPIPIRLQPKTHALLSQKKEDDVLVMVNDLVELDREPLPSTPVVTQNLVPPVLPTAAPPEPLPNTSLLEPPPNVAPPEPLPDVTLSEPSPTLSTRSTLAFGADHRLETPADAMPSFPSTSTLPLAWPSSVEPEPLTHPSSPLPEFTDPSLPLPTGEISTSSSVSLSAQQDLFVQNPVIVPIQTTPALSEEEPDPFSMTTPFRTSPGPSPTALIVVVLLAGLLLILAALFFLI